MLLYAVDTRPLGKLGALGGRGAELRERVNPAGADIWRE